MSASNVESKLFAAQSAWQRLKLGNDRFTQGLRSIDSFVSVERVRELAEKGQSPHTVILTCSDSRLPAENLFDCGLGELFVIRVAGNVVTPALLASVEFSAKFLGTSLCLVMGHSRCGAVSAAIDMDTKGASMDLTPHLRGLVSEIHPAVENVSRRELSMSAEEFREHVTEENVRLGVRTILNESQALREMAQAQQFFVCGAVYDTFTGRVELVEDKASALISEGIFHSPAVDQRPNGLQNRRS